MNIISQIRKWQNLLSTPFHTLTLSLHLSLSLCLSLSLSLSLALACSYFFLPLFLHLYLLLPLFPPLSPFHSHSPAYFVSLQCVVQLISKCFGSDTIQVLIPSSSLFAQTLFPPSYFALNLYLKSNSSTQTQ